MQATLRYLLMAFAGLAAAGSTSHGAELPLGDRKATTQGPLKGHVFLCRQQVAGGGAFRKGEWIGDATWDPARKTVVVGGNVAWPGASMSIEASGATRAIRGNGLPAHVTGQFPVRPDDPAARYDRNPNSIRQQRVDIALPRDPQIAPRPSCVGGEIGMALSGAYIFNAFDAQGRDAAAHEIQDAHGGHPQPAGVYHYHRVAPALEKLGRTDDGMTLVGYAFDGFGIYGSLERGRKVVNDDLDECHGHAHAIVWDGRRVGMYHYHATDAFPYTVACYKGTPVRLPPAGGPPGGSPGGRPPPPGHLPPPR